MSAADWVAGDMLNVAIPAHATALHEGGTRFLSKAFHASGALPRDNHVASITQFEECPGGSTGRKLLLSVAYEQPARELHTELFVKFSRDFDNEIRDRSRNQLESEVRLALLSRTPAFPIAVPACYFADYHRESGTGILVTERIAFGTNGVEPAYEKCLDYEMPEMLAHYRALLRALARLAGTHKAGRLDASVATQFPFDAEQAVAMDRIRYTEQQLLNRVARYAEFAAAAPRLLPAQLTSAQFIDKLAKETPRFLQHEVAIREYLHEQADYIALCHWNANIDNAWFWRNAQGELECGLMDWGRVGQMNVALALFGALSAAELELWNDALPSLLTLFTREVQQCGGPVLETQELKFQLMLFVALMGLAWLMDAPALIRRQIPDVSQLQSRFDPRLKANETARVQLHMLTTVLHLWQTEDFGGVLDRFLERTQ
jgi:hypothetical protein